jgi:hypothetical protein
MMKMKMKMKLQNKSKPHNEPNTTNNNTRGVRLAAQRNVCIAEAREKEEGRRGKMQELPHMQTEHACNDNGKF